MTKAKRLSSLLLVSLIFCCLNCVKQTQEDKVNYLKDFPPTDKDGNVNVVVEIPAGTLEKWEVTKPEGGLMLENINGKPRIVQYIGYPGNYGMVPRTLLPKSEGGDGDPLDVLVIGSSAERGSIVPVKVIGVLRLLDGGEQDDKLIAVQANSPLYHINGIEELAEGYNGITEIVETWFSNYKGPDKLVSNGYAGPEAANEILQTAISAYEKTK